MQNHRLLALTSFAVLALSCAGSSLGGGGTSGDNGSGGVNGNGGSTSSGGSTTTGGSTGTGGILGSGGRGGATSAGGITGTGGVLGTGGRAGGGAGTSGSSGGGAGHAADGSSAAGTTGTGAGGGAPGTGGSSAGGGSGAASAENTGVGSCTASAGALLSADNKKLPNPFALHNGTVISTKAQWECRRQEIMQDIYKYEIGPKPDPSQTTVAATLSGKTLSVKVTSSSGSLTLTSAISGSGNCILITMDTAPSLVTGCTTVPFTSNQVVQNMQNSNQYQSDPYYKVFPSLWGKIGNYSAWSWGISRLIDGIGQVASQLNVDMTKIAVHGCSYAGKMAMFGGALDERVALTVIEESGGGGIDSWRLSQEFTDRTGTQVEKIDNTNYAWFMSSMKNLDPYKLPHDHHDVIGLIAPRAAIALGNDGYDWLGDESGYKSIMAALQIFTALGVPHNLGYDFTSNHPHCSPPATQQQSVSAYVTRFLQGGTTDPNVAIKPPSTSFDLNWQGAIDWTTPTLQ